jgi:hypothetical protein
MALLGAACSQVTAAPPAQVVDPHDIVIAQPDGGDFFLFIAATGGNELRVVNLSLAVEDFVRAPNPLEPLSIPVVDQPVELAVDTAYLGGQPLTGPYVYSRGTGSPQISVIDSNLTEFLPDGGAAGGMVEVMRIVAPGVVTAIGARGPDPVNDGGAHFSAMSRLYAATFDGTRSGLWEYDLPGPTGAAPPFAPAPTFLGAADPGETITALLPIPSSEEIAIATRSASDGGRTLAFNPFTAQSRPLSFPAPVRQLKSHAAFPSSFFPDGGFATTVAEGSYLYGLLDEGACRGQVGCRGIVAVATLDGGIAPDDTGLPMLPIDPGAGPIQGFEFMPGAFLPNAAVLYDAGCPNSAGANCQYGLLGLGTTGGTATSSGTIGGELFFFDGQRFKLFGVTPALTDGGIVAEALLSSDGRLLSQDAGTGLLLGSVQPQAGGARTETVSITYQGLLPLLSGVEAQATDGGFLPGVTYVTQLNGQGVPVLLPTAQAQDFVILSGIPQAGAAGVDGGVCDQVLRVGQVALPPEQPGVVLDPSIPIPAECASFTEYAIRAGGAQPYVVQGSTSGFLGRVGPEQTFTGGSYFYRASGFNPGAAPLSFQMGAQDPQVIQDTAYQLVLDVPFTHYFFWPDPTTFTGGAGIPAGLVPDSVSSFLIPGTDPTNLNNPEFFFVSYPARNGVLRLDPRNGIVPTVLISFQSFVFFGSG